MLACEKPHVFVTNQYLGHREGRNVLIVFRLGNRRWRGKETIYSRRVALALLLGALPRAGLSTTLLLRTVACDNMLM